MTYHVARHSCGHEVRHDLSTVFPVWKRPWVAEQRAKKPCPTCSHTEWKADVDSTNAYYAELAKEHGLPQITGTDRQVPWAVGLRGEFLDQVTERWPELVRLAGDDPARQVDPAGRDLVRELALERIDAAWWISNRETLAYRLYCDGTARFKQAGKQPGQPGHTAASLLRLIASG